MSFDPTRDPVTPRDAASVILIRERAGADEVEVFMLRRHKRASFMSSAFVFPGGAADAGETDMRLAAARELFEEAGVLLCHSTPGADTLAEWRRQVAAGQSLSAQLDRAGVSLSLDPLVPVAHWITPSAEKKRFSARFFVAPMPAGQEPSFDNVETVDQVWVTPSEGLERAAELRLPPPQIHTLTWLRSLGAGSVDRVVRGVSAHIDSVEPILPRFAPLPDTPSGFGLLLPWDPAYNDIGTGLGRALATNNPMARGASRFILVDGGWQLVEARDSP